MAPTQIEGETATELPAGVAEAMRVYAEAQQIYAAAQPAMAAMRTKVVVSFTAGASSA